MVGQWHEEMEHSIRPWGSQVGDGKAVRIRSGFWVYNPPNFSLGQDETVGDPRWEGGRKSGLVLVSGCVTHPIFHWGKQVNPNPNSGPNPSSETQGKTMGRTGNWGERRSVHVLPAPHATYLAVHKVEYLDQVVNKLFLLFTGLLPHWIKSLCLPETLTGSLVVLLILVSLVGSTLGWKSSQLGQDPSRIINHEGGGGGGSLRYAPPQIVSYSSMFRLKLGTELALLL